MALASAITATWERRWEWWCMKERGLEVAHPYRVRSIAEAPDARVWGGCGVDVWRRGRSLQKKLVRLKKPRLPSALGLSGACGVAA
eukprot:scaffold10301_cov121-Isochrysis_galbana.AAC.5